MRLFNGKIKCHGKTHFNLLHSSYSYIVILNQSQCNYPEIKHYDWMLQIMEQVWTNQASYSTVKLLYKIAYFGTKVPLRDFALGPRLSGMYCHIPIGPNIGLLPFCYSDICVQTHNGRSLVK